MYYAGRKDGHKPDAPAKALRWRVRLVGDEVKEAKSAVSAPRGWQDGHGDALACRSNMSGRSLARGKPQQMTRARSSRVTGLATWHGTDRQNSKGKEGKGLERGTTMPTAGTKLAR